MDILINVALFLIAIHTIRYITNLILDFKLSIVFQDQLENLDNMIAVIFDNMYTNKIRNNIAIDNELKIKEENELVNECIKKFRKIVSPKLIGIYTRVLDGDEGLNNYITIRFLSLYNKIVDAKKIKPLQGFQTNSKG